MAARRGSRLTLVAASTTARATRITPQAARVASYTTTSRLDAFHTQLENAASSPFPSASKTAVQNPQTLTEKIVQRYAVGLAPGKKVKAGDYVTLRMSSFR